MTRALVLGLLLLARLASAAPAFFFPGSVGEQRQAVPAANTLYCYTLPAAHAASATKLALWVDVVVGGATTGVAIYPDGDASNALAKTSGIVAVKGSLSTTGQTIPLVAGTRYRLCFCATSTSIQIAAVQDSGTGSGRIASLLNAATLTTTAGTGAHSCDGTNGSSGNGDPPTTTGALTAATNFRCPKVLVEE